MGGQPWFPAKDVCEMLDINNSRQATTRLHRTERKHVSPLNVTTNDVAKLPNRGMTCISETGVYKMVMLSRKKNAEAFQDWVAEVVLPAISRDGMYV